MLNLNSSFPVPTEECAKHRLHDVFAIESFDQGRMNISLRQRNQLLSVLLEELSKRPGISTIEIPLKFRPCRAVKVLIRRHCRYFQSNHVARRTDFSLLRRLLFFHGRAVRAFENDLSCLARTSTSAGVAANDFRHIPHLAPSIPAGQVVRPGFGSDSLAAARLPIRVFGRAFVKGRLDAGNHVTRCRHRKWNGGLGTAGSAGADAAPQQKNVPLIDDVPPHSPEVRSLSTLLPERRSADFISRLRRTRRGKYSVLTVRP